MLTDEVIDEDIEALLYAQVYYGKSDCDNLVITPQSDLGLDKDGSGATVNGESHETNIVPEKALPATNFDLEEQQGGNEGQEPDPTPSLETHNKSHPSPSQLSLNVNIPLEIFEKPNNPDLSPKNKDQDHSVISQQQYIEISTSTASSTDDKTPTQIVAQIPLLTAPSNASNQQQLLNNITINQYICPGEDFLKRLKVFRENIVWSKQCEKDLKRLQRGKLNEKDFFKILKRRLHSQKNKLKKQEQIRNLFFKRQQKIASSEIICLSDSDNSDIEIVAVEAPPKPKPPVMKSKPAISTETTSVEESNEDEIIYVAPPPVPVIEVEDETDEEKTTQDVDEASNDFLAPTNASENFNFSLHGSEFQDAEFVKPANPTDTYETESSTSTSDFNRESSREFSNTVKTIVFNEVDFPREDIFEGTNLEKFGQLITPKRGSSKSEDNENGKKESESSSKRCKKSNRKASSESSSESDYDAHRNLPDLSPMICAERSPRKSQKNKAETTKKNEEASASAKSSKKAKHSNNFSEENEPENVTETSTTRKTKRHSSGSPPEDDVPKKKAKNKKKKSGSKRREDLEISVKNAALPKDKSDVSSPIRNLQSSGIVTSTPSGDDRSGLGDQLEAASKRRSRKKKKPIRIINDSVSDVTVDASVLRQDTSDDPTKKKPKKKKGLVDQSDTAEDAVPESPSPREMNGSEHSGKKKAKKSKQRVPSSSKVATADSVVADTLQDVVPLESDAIPLENASGNQRKNRRKKDKEKQSSLEAEGTALKEAQTVDKPDARTGEKVVVEESQQSEEEEDIMIIEQAIPVHTIESSDSDKDDDDIITFNDLNDELLLANINDDVGVENPKSKFDLNVHDIEYIQSKMSDDPDKWKILAADRQNMNVGKKGPRCNRCRQFGHMALHCPNKSHIPICSLCGYEGHQEPRCPNKVCFSCAKPGNYSTVFCYQCSYQRNEKCYVCQMPGHLGNNCPDLWRRYFLTTKEGPVIKPSIKLKMSTRKSKRNQWCSGCATKGHLEYKCNSYKWIREYPRASPYIFKYEDIYDNKEKNVFEPRNRHNRKSQNDQETIVETSQVPVAIVDAESDTVKEQAHNIPDEAVNKSVQTETATIENPSQRSEVLQFEAPQPVNQELAFTPPKDPEPIPLDPREPGPMFYKPPPRESIYLPTAKQMRYTFRNREKRQPHRAKLNPLSVLTRPDGPTGFTPYQSVLNPYSVMATPAMVDTGAPFMDDAGSSALNYMLAGTETAPAPLPLFNSVPSNVLAQQLLNHPDTLPDYQLFNPGEGQYDFSQDDGFQGLQYNMQVPPEQTHQSNYIDFSQPAHGDRYFEFTAPRQNFPNRDFLNVPYTITKESSRDLDRQHSNRYSGSSEFPWRRRDAVCLMEDSTSTKFAVYDVEALKRFIISELDKLDNIKSPDPKVYKRKLNQIDQLKKIEVKSNAVKKQIFFQYKQINMYLFGLRRLGDGKRSLDFLRNFAGNTGNKLTKAKRRALLEAYCFIFGGEHPYFDYRKHLNVMSLRPGHGT